MSTALGRCYPLPCSRHKHNKWISSVPNRPSQHQLEDQSRIAFQSVLPKAWVFRQLTPDYGVDAAVEIFTDSGVSTGDQFLVQLKATANTKLARALTVRLPVETAKYYRSLSLPLLIVLHHAPAEKIYGDWFRTLDIQKPTDRKTVTLRLKGQNEWGSKTAGEVASDIAAIRLIGAPEAKPPIPFHLEWTAPEIGGVPSGYICSEIIEKAKGLIDAITPDSEPPAPARISVKLDPSDTTISIGRLIRFRIRTPGALRDPTSASKFVHDVLTGIGVVLARAGQFNAAARVFGICALYSTLLKDPEVVHEVVGSMARAHRIIDALRLSDELHAKGEPSLAALFLFLVALVKADQLSNHEKKEVRLFLERQLKWAEEAGDKQRIAVAHYNLGNQLHKSNSRLALHHYRKAAEYDPGYLKRGYFWRELGGIFFERQRYWWAERCYKRALRLGERGLCQALHADALMFAGRYHEAEVAFAAYLRTNPTSASEWRLKHWALAYVRTTLGYNLQQRQVVKALKLAGIEGSGGGQEAKQRLGHALELDALCGLAWFNLGVYENSTGNRRGAFEAFLIAALIQRWDVEAWCNALFLAVLESVGQSLIPDIMRAAYFANGKRLSDQVLKFAHSQPKGFPVAEFVNLVESALCTPPKEQEPVTARLLTGGVVRSLSVRPS